MASKEEGGLHGEAIRLFGERGLEGIGEAIRCVIDEAMRLEREKFLGVGAYERNEDRRGYANGFKPKTVQTRVGELTFSIPQVREGGFYPKSLEKGMRSEHALQVALGEMYVQGVSTRKVAKITTQLCGFEVSSDQVSRAARVLDETLEKWRNRPLGAYPYVYLDARYEKVRESGQVRGCAVLVAIGVNMEGHREVLGVSVALSEQEVHWRNFLSGLQQRGLHGVRLFVSDAHEGLKAARQAVFPSIPWQRCQFHLQQNAQAYVPRLDMKQQVASEIRAIFNAPGETEGLRLLALFVDRYRKSAPRLAQWAEENLLEGFTVFQFPEAHWRKIRTSNGLERVNRAIKQRTSVVAIFPNPASCLRLVSAILMEISEDWASEQVYLTLQNPYDPMTLFKTRLRNTD